MAAVPGTSNHGWGLAIDLAEKVNGKAVSISPRSVKWLIKHAAQYGFCAEAQSEPWHWRYFTGDKIPAAVLAFEAGS
jgi:LAS superfamily LD-carboxypeptidase LdcB